MPIFGNIPGFVGRLGNFFHLAKVAMALRPACAGRAVGSGGPRQTGCGSGRQRKWKIWKWERENGKEATPHLLPLARCTGGSTITLIPFPAALLIAPGVLGCGVGVMAADQQLLYFVFYYHIAWREPLPPLEYFTKPKKTLTEKAKTSNKTLYFGGTIAELPVF